MHKISVHSQDPRALQTPFGSEALETLNHDATMPGYLMVHLPDSPNALSLRSDPTENNRRHGSRIEGKLR